MSSRDRGTPDAEHRRQNAASAPRRLGDVLSPALGRLASSDQAKAYAAWVRAVGEQVARGTRPKAFSRGRLTVACSSSVWANELTLLGPQILRRMDEVAAGHPVRGFRFTIDESAGDPGEPAAGQEEEGPAAKQRAERGALAPTAYDAALTQARGVRDERLRAAIEAALRRSSSEPSRGPITGGD